MDMMKSLYDDGDDETKVGGLSHHTMLYLTHTTQRMIAKAMAESRSKSGGF